MGEHHTGHKALGAPGRQPLFFQPTRAPLASDSLQVSPFEVLWMYLEKYAFPGILVFPRLSLAPLLSPYLLAIASFHLSTKMSLYW